MKKRTMRFRFKLLLLVLFLAYAGFAIFGQQSRIGELQAEQDALSETLSEAQLELDRLEHKSEYMNTDDYVENAAREKFGLSYDDEIVIETQDDESD